MERRWIYFSEYERAIMALQDEINDAGLTMLPATLAKRATKKIFEAAGLDVYTDPPVQYREDGPA